MRTALAVTLLLSLAPAASADPMPTQAPEPPAMTGERASNDCAIARAHNRQCVLDMSGEEVDGRKIVPPGLDTTIVPMGKYGSLIRLRKDFIDKIVKTADDL